MNDIQHMTSIQETPMKILLVLPAADHLRVTEGSAVPARAMLRFSILPLLTVAALTPPEHEVRIVDENVSPVPLDADVDLVGISFMTALAPRAYEIARLFRARGIPTVAGGYHPTLNPEEAAAHFDAVVAGEAEGVWAQVLAAAACGRLERIYRAPLADPAAIPVPRRDLLAPTARHYVTTNAVQTGRGCPHGCRYCSIAAFFRSSHRSRPLAHVLKELATVPRHFMFVDDNIIADRDYVRALFTAMAPLKKRWVSQCALDIADDPELLRLAHAAGCRGLFIGLESASEENLAGMGKSFNDPRRYRQRIAAIRRAGIGVQAGIIVGLDHDDPAVFQRTLAYLDRLGIDALQLNILTPLPGTPLFDDLESQGRIVDRDWSHYDFRHAVIRPRLMTRGQLQEGADWLYAQYYRLDRIVWRAARTLWNVGFLAAIMALRLNLTYRYDNRREGITGRNPAADRPAGHPVTALAQVPAS
jgi:radical SAM superfamily enzyme YgiQ (UPF0313 family)